MRIGAAAIEIALDIEHFAALGLHHQLEGLGMQAQSFDGAFDLGCRLRFQPSPEGQEVRILLWGTRFGGKLAEQLRLAVMALPDHGAPVLVGDEGLVARNLVLAVGIGGAQFSDLDIESIALAKEHCGEDERSGNRAQKHCITGHIDAVEGGHWRAGRLCKNDTRGEEAGKGAAAGQQASHGRHGRALCHFPQHTRRQVRTWPPEAWKTGRHSRIPLTRGALMYRHFRSVSVLLCAASSTRHPYPRTARAVHESSPKTIPSMDRVGKAGPQKRKRRPCQGAVYYM